MSSDRAPDLIAKEAVDIEAMLGCLAVGAFLIWLGIQALDPAWMVPTNAHGRLKLFEDLFAWLSSYVSTTARGSIVIGLGAIFLLLAFGIALYSLFWREQRLVIDTNGIEIPKDESKLRIVWKEIAKVEVIENTFVVSRRVGENLTVNVSEIDKSRRDIFAAIECYRPELLAHTAPG